MLYSISFCSEWYLTSQQAGRLVSSFSYGEDKVDAAVKVGTMPACILTLDSHLNAGHDERLDRVGHVLYCRTAISWAMNHLTFFIIIFYMAAPPRVTSKN